MIVLGIDPGLAALGISVLDPLQVRPHVIHAETVRTPAGDAPHDRMAKLYERIMVTLYEFSPGVIAWESQHRAAIGKASRGQSNAHAAWVREVVGMIRGASFTYAFDHHPTEVSPAEAKRAVGCRATAGKREVVRAVRTICHRCPQRLSEHAADAIAIAIAGARKARAVKVGMHKIGL